MLMAFFENVYLCQLSPLISPSHIQIWKMLTTYVCSELSVRDKYVNMTKKSCGFVLKFLMQLWSCCQGVLNFKKKHWTYTNSNSKPIRCATILIARDPGVISISYNMGFADIFDNKFICFYFYELQLKTSYLIFSTI